MRSCYNLRMHKSAVLGEDFIADLICAQALVYQLLQRNLINVYDLRLIWQVVLKTKLCWHKFDTKVTRNYL